MKVLSLFDGISCGKLALSRAKVKVEKYFASEIDPKAIDISRANHPDIIRLGDVRQINAKELGEIDLLIGGSPCTDLSFAGKKSGLESANLQDYLDLKESGYEFSTKSYLFWEFIRLKEELNPKYYLLENVRMKKEHRNIIDKILGKPIFIESANFSASMRKRLYWTNIPIEVKEKKDYLELVNNGNFRKEHTIKDCWLGGIDITERYLALKGKTKKQTMGDKCPPGEENELASSWKTAKTSTKTLYDKAKCLTVAGQMIGNTGATNVKIGDRYYSPNIETCESLMTLPPRYTYWGLKEDGKSYQINKTARSKAIGNGWTVDVIKEFFKVLK